MEAINMSIQYTRQVPQLTKFFPAIRWARVTAPAPKAAESLSVQNRPADQTGGRKNVQRKIANEETKKTSSSNSFNGSTNPSDGWETDDESDSIEKMRTAISVDNVVAIPSKVLDASCWDADEFFVRNIPVAVSTPVPKKILLDELPEESPAAFLFFSLSDDENETVCGAIENVESVFSLTRTSDLPEDTKCEEFKELENKDHSLNGEKRFQQEENEPKSMVCECNETVPADATEMGPRNLSVPYHGKTPKTSKSREHNSNRMPGRILNMSEKTLVESEKTLVESEKTLVESEKIADTKQVKRHQKRKKNIPLCSITTVQLVASPLYLKVPRIPKEQLAKIKIDDITLI